MEKKRREVVICFAGYLAGALTWLITITAWLAVERTRALHDPRLWYDSVHALAFETRHGCEFLLVTLHLWGSMFSVFALAWARRRTMPLMTVSSLLLLIVCFSLLLTSIRWFDGEMRPFFNRYRGRVSPITGKPVFIQPPFSLFGSTVFESELDYRVLLAGTLAFLGVLAIWWKSSARTTPAVRDGASLNRTIVDRLKMRPSTIGFSVVILALVLALFIQHRRAVDREGAILRRGDSLLGAVNERIREKSRENEILRRRLEGHQSFIDREKLTIQDRLPGLDVSLTDAWKRSNIVAVASYLGCPLPNYISHFIWHYSGAGLNVKTVLKGASVEGESMKTSFWLNERSELPPMAGKDYIFFIERTGGGYQVIKILQNTLGNVQAVRRRRATMPSPRD